jgi:hypothetical protein
MTVKQNDGEAKSSEMQDGVTVLPNVNTELALAELEALACALLHPTAHNTCARRGPRIESNALHHSPVYLLLNWKRLRAPFWPYFLRSLERASRERKPSPFSFLRNSTLNSSRARAMPIFKAPA